jgi:hypothetical protein
LRDYTFPNAGSISACGPHVDPLQVSMFLWQAHALELSFRTALTVRDRQQMPSIIMN